MPLPYSGRLFFVPHFRYKNFGGDLLELSKNKTMILLATERLVLREFEETDAAFVLELLNSKGWLEYIGDRGIGNIEAARKYINEKYRPAYHCEGPAMYLVELKEDGIRLGMCGLIKRAHLEHADIGFAFLPQFAGNGYAYEAAEAILQYAKDDLEMHHLLAIVIPDNAPSIRLLEKLNFEFEKMIHDNGEELKLYRKAVQ
jgi:ribosomal-protein-alanine N-acetyltransferase